MSSLIKHYPVMCRNVLAQIGDLNLRRPIRIADCNFGFGGHSLQILERFPNAQIQAYDLDPSVIDYFQHNYAQHMTQSVSRRLTITVQNYSALSTSKIFPKFDVILADLGFNSFHLQTEKGFSWRKDGPLDMRYSPGFKTCGEIINHCSLLELINLLSQFGQLKNPRVVAEAIVNSRPILTTKQLYDCALPCFSESKTRRIAQVFQAFRIATNDELGSLEQLMRQMEGLLDRKGLALLVTFHSLQRDIVHRVLRQNKANTFSKIRVDTPDKAELEENSRSASARMLSFRKMS